MILIFIFVPFFYWTDEAEHIPHRDTPWYQRLYNCVFGFDDSEKAQVRTLFILCIDYWYNRTKNYPHKRFHKNSRNLLVVNAVRVEYAVKGKYLIYTNFLSWYYCFLLLFIQEQAMAMNEHIAQLTTLHQEPWEKNLLNVMLVIIIITTVACYTYFSINPFSEEEVKEIQRKKLEELGYTDVLWAWDVCTAHLWGPGFACKAFIYYYYLMTMLSTFLSSITKCHGYESIPSHKRKMILNLFKDRNLFILYALTELC